MLGHCFFCLTGNFAFDWGLGLSLQSMMSSSRSENNVAEMTMHATDPIDDEVKSEESGNAISNPYAGKDASDCI